MIRIQLLLVQNIKKEYHEYLTSHTGYSTKKQSHQLWNFTKVLEIIFWYGSSRYWHLQIHDQLLKMWEVNFINRHKGGALKKLCWKISFHFPRKMPFKQMLLIINSNSNNTRNTDILIRVTSNESGTFQGFVACLRNKKWQNIIIIKN